MLIAEPPRACGRDPRAVMHIPRRTQFTLKIIWQNLSQVKERSSRPLNTSQHEQSCLHSTLIVNEEKTYFRIAWESTAAGRQHRETGDL